MKQGPDQVPTKHEDLRHMQDDARVLGRSAAIHLAGLVVRWIHPVLLALTTRAYGATRWGVYGAGLALSWIGLRLIVLGDDRALLWWIPKIRSREGTIRGLRPILKRIAWRSVVGGLAAWWLISPLAKLWEMTAFVDTLHLMACGMALMPMTEACLQGTVAHRTMKYDVAIRVLLVPLTFMGLALAYAVAGNTTTGLGWSFVWSNALGLVASAWAFHRCLKASRSEALSAQEQAKEHEGDEVRTHLSLSRAHRARRTRTMSLTKANTVPAEFDRYARSLGFAELCNTALRRSDKLILAFVASPAIVGIYDVVTQFGSTLLGIRSGFDGIVTTVVAGADNAKKQNVEGRDAPGLRPRVVRSLSHATSLVLLCQLPIAAFFITFAEPLLELFGEGFREGAAATRILCIATVFAGAAGLAGQVVNGLGRSRWSLRASAATLVLQTVLLLALAPLGLAAAAVAIGVSLLFLGIVQVRQASRLLGTFPYDRSALRPAGLGAGGLGLCMLLLATLALMERLPTGGLSPSGTSIGDYAWPLLALMSFLPFYGAAAWPLRPRRRPATAS